MSAQYILLGIFVLLSAFFSGSETAFILSNKLKMEVKARMNIYSAKKILYFNGHQEKLFSTILLGNNIANIGFASVFSLLFAAQLSEWQLLLYSTFFILIFGELFPKYFSREYPDIFTMITISPLYWLSKSLSPVIKVISFLPSVISGRKKLNEEAYTNYFDREDLDELVKESEQAGSVSQTESEMISKVLQLRNQKVNQAMRPRTEIIGVDIDSKIEDVLKTFIESGYSKLPVYDDNFDNIKGIVFAYDLFNQPKTLSEVTRTILFVPEARKSIDVLNDFLKQNISFAVVVDEFGGTSGIITLEDIIEELFGEIKDEYDTEEEICRKIDERTYILNGKIEIDYLNENYDLLLPKGEYETVAGFITSKIGRIPQQNEDIKIDDFIFHIVRSSEVKIELVKLQIPNPHHAK